MRASSAEARRLRELPLADLAVEIMAAFGDGGLDRELNILSIRTWLLRSYKRPMGWQVLWLLNPLGRSLVMLEKGRAH